MLRFKLLITVFFFILTICIALSPRRAQSISSLRRLTNTTEQSLNLNPMLSDDGQVLSFESTADIAATGGSTSFRALQANLTSDSPRFVQIARTRAVASPLSSNGQLAVFASNEDLLGENPDRNLRSQEPAVGSPFLQIDPLLVWLVPIAASISSTRSMGNSAT
jgi:WD40-like Beta Propeller Repeat